MIAHKAQITTNIKIDIYDDLRNIEYNNNFDTIELKSTSKYKKLYTKLFDVIGILRDSVTMTENLMEGKRGRITVKFDRIANIKKDANLVFDFGTERRNLENSRCFRPNIICSDYIFFEMSRKKAENSIGRW